MLDAATQALGALFDPAHLAFVLLGASVGLLLGVLPGMGGTVGMSLLLPFVFGMDPYTGTALLIGMYAGPNTADTFPAVLLGVPGTSASQATILDGYPLARQGRANTALGAAFSASIAGGIIGSIALLALLFAARPIVLALGSPELFMLVVLGLSMVSVLSRQAPLAGLTAGAFGVLLGTVGTAPATSAYRFTFDQIYLNTGIPLAVFALGLFAVPEILDLLSSGRSIAGGMELRGSRLAGVREVLRRKRLVVQGSLIGVGVGIIPGLGGSVSQWMSYGIARQTLPDTERSFGKGDVRGLIAPESTNNADNGGTLIPALAFGIPGNGSTAIFLAGFALLGLQPGPSMLRGQGLSVSLTIVWSLILGTIFAGLICFALSGWIARLTLLPASKLMPFILLAIVLAAYQTTNSWFDIFVLLVMGAMGWIMKRADWPRPPMLVGFVLAEPAERYLNITMNTYGAEWLTRPGVLLLGVLTAAIIGSVALRGRVSKLLDRSRPR